MQQVLYNEYSGIEQYYYIISIVDANVELSSCDDHDSASCTSDMNYCLNGLKTYNIYRIPKKKIFMHPNWIGGDSTENMGDTIELTVPLYKTLTKSTGTQELSQLYTLYTNPETIEVEFDTRPLSAVEQSHGDLSDQESNYNFGEYKGN